MTCAGDNVGLHSTRSNSDQRDEPLSRKSTTNTLWKNHSVLVMPLLDD